MKPNSSKVLRSAPVTADSQHTALSTQHSALSTSSLSRILLATCALLLFSLAGLRAQVPEYSFRLQFTDDGDRYDATTDDAPILSMDCLAANGYGQWTLSSRAGTGTTTPTTKYVPGWFLLANGLYKPSAKYVPTQTLACIPPGVVQNGQLGGTYPTEPKSAANFDDAACYVCPSVGGNSFLVQFVTKADIDISLSFLTNHILPPDIVFPTAPHFSVVITSGHNILTGSVAESDFRDDFDVKMDAYYTYYVWATMDAGIKEIWAMAVPIGSVTPTIGPVLVGDGKFPTVDCDARNNRLGPHAPQFDVAFIDNTGLPEDWQYSGGFHQCVLNTNFPDPRNSSYPNLYPVNYRHVRAVVSQVLGFPGMVHGMYAIAEITSGYHGTNSGLALILYPTLLQGAGPSNTAAYCDGALLTSMPNHMPQTYTTQPVVVDEPITALSDPYDNQSTFDGFHCVYRDSAHYYYTGTSSIYRYPLIIMKGYDNGTSNAPGPNTRLLLNTVKIGAIWTMLSDAPKGPIAAVSPGTVTPYVPPVVIPYVAAVNQMGIHVHWHAIDSVPTTPVWAHYYSRDTSRTFDEPIDENTLVTDICTISDGTAHGGTMGATIISPHTTHTMAIWTDPNYGPPNADGTYGLYSPRVLTFLDPHVGTLIFSGSGVTLQIGDGTDFESILATMPYFFCDFTPGAGQGITVNGGSLFDYYGHFATHSPTAIATPFTDGSADGYGAGTIDLDGGGSSDEAYLNVHGGSDFCIGIEGTLISNTGSIDVAHENSVYPFPASPPATGHMTLWGTSTITSSFVTGNAPAATSSDPGVDVIITSYGEFTATNSDFWNTWGYPDYGQSNIQFVDILGDPFLTTSITSSEFVATQIHAFIMSCADSLTVEGNTLDQLRNYGVLVENVSYNPASATRPPITISDNYFYAFAPNAYSVFMPGNDWPNLYGIWVRNLSHIPNRSYRNCDESAYGAISISGNQFTESNYSIANSALLAAVPDDPDFLPLSGAIVLENTTADVTSNVVEDDGYSVGIAEVGVKQPKFAIPTTQSLICSNTISGMTNPSPDFSARNFEIGMCTSFFIGYIQNNTITGCDYGYASSQGDLSHFICNTETGNGYITLTVNEGSELDMSGIHSPESTGAYDYAAFNTISGPSVYTNLSHDFPLILMYEDGNIVLSHSQETWTWGCTSGVPNYGRNDITLNPSTASGPLIQGDGIDLQDIRSVDGNYFGVGIDPAIGAPCAGALCSNAGDPCIAPCYTTPYNWNWGTSGYRAIVIQYCATTAATYGPFTSLPDWASGCQDWVTLLSSSAMRKGSKPQSLMDSIDTCSYFYNYGTSLNQFDEWQDSYDTLRLAIARCPLAYESYKSFSTLGDDVQNFLVANNYQQDSSIYANYRSWLYSVLYLNTIDPNYFCACVNQIFGCFGYIKNDTTEEQNLTAGNMSVAFSRWLIQSTNCDSSQAWADWQNVRREQFQLWYDDSIAGLHYPYDTTIPTLSQIGYGIDTLLAKHQPAMVSDPAAPRIILSATASPNPVSTGTIITFGLSQVAYVKINLFDILGHGVAGSGGEGFEGLFQPGNHEVPLSLQGLPSGIYYARILTAYGSVATVKLVKEQ